MTIDPTETSPKLVIGSLNFYNRPSVEKLIRHLTKEIDILWPKEKTKSKK